MSLDINADNPSFFQEIINLLKMERFAGSETYLDFLLNCWAMTFMIAGASWIVALIVGASIGTIRTLPAKGVLNRLLIFFGNTWVHIFRNIPVLLQMFIWLYVVPQLIPVFQIFIEYPFMMAMFGLGFFTSARIAEQVKAGIDAIPSGQKNAAKALGLTQLQTYRHILLPIATRIIMPPLISEAMNIVKNSTAAIALSLLPELLNFVMQAGVEQESYIIHIYLIATVLFAITSLVFYVVMRLVEKKLRIPGYLTGGSAGGH